jgi:alpha-tubulin suppressor-like RCC1 family protein
VSTSGVLDGKTLTSIDAGYQHTCALDSDGQAYCWGNNYNGQLGNATTTTSAAPVAVSTSGVLSGRSLTDINAGGQTTCALSASGEAFCWGMGWSGAMGNGTSAEVNASPVAVDASGVLSGVTLTQISLGGLSVCGVSDVGRVYCWGGNSLGQLGIGNRTDQLLPVAMGTAGVLSGARVRLIGTGTETWMVTEQQ